MNQARDVERKYPNQAALSASTHTTVYRSADPNTGAPVVVKLIETTGRPEERVQSRRFLKVIGTLQTLGSKAFPRIIDFGIADERTAFLITDTVDGEALSEWTDSAPDRVLLLLAQIVDTLEALSRSGICHHNLTGHNLAVSTSGGVDQIRFLGLGTAAYIEHFKGSTNPDDPRATRYVAPERLLPGSKNGGDDWRSDLFSVALIAAEALGADIKGVGGTHPSVVLPIAVRGALVNPGDLGGILETALRGDPRQRQIGWSDLYDAMRCQAPETPNLDATMAIPIDRLPKMEPPHVAEPPTVEDFEYETKQGTALEIGKPGVLDRASDPDGGDLVAKLESGPSSGDLDLGPDGAFTYVPRPDFHGLDSFTYRADNSELESEPATVTIRVLEVKPPPVAVDDRYETNQDVALRIPAPGVLANDHDADGADLTARFLAGPSYGDLTLEGDGSFVYEPHPGFFGVDSFTYRAMNSELESDPATVTITVNEIRKPPVAVDDTYEMDQDKVLRVDAPGVLGNDNDPGGGKLAAVALGNPANGDLELRADGSFEYHPKPGFFGVDSFSYCADNGELESESATVAITVTEIKAPPIATDDQYATAQDEKLIIETPGILDNDSVESGAWMQAVLVSHPADGKLTLESSGSFVYEPDPGFFGVDRFTYAARAEGVDSDPATVTITVIEIEAPPVEEEDRASTFAGITGEEREPFVEAQETGVDEIEEFSSVEEPEEGPPEDPTRETAEDLDTGLTRVQEIPPPVEPPPIPVPPPVPESMPAPPRIPEPEEFVPPPVPTPAPDPGQKPDPIPTPEPTPDPIPTPDPKPTPDPGAARESSPELESPETHPEPDPRSDKPGAGFSLPEMSRRNMAIAGAALILLIVVIIAFWPGSGDDEAAQSPQATPVPTVRPTRTPAPMVVAPAINPILERAQDALIDGDSDTARSELAALTEDEIAFFTDEERNLYEELTTSLEGSEFELAVQDLRGGFWWSSVKMIRRAVPALAAFEPDEIAQVAGLDQELARGQEALRYHSLMYEARDNGDVSGVLESASALIAILPDYSRALEWREEAAVSLEDRADAAAANGDIDLAESIIDPITLFWSVRDGHQARIERYRGIRDENRALRSREAEFEALLDEAAAKGASGLPDEGLRLLRNRTSPASLADRHSDLMDALNAQLVELDASPPSIDIPADVEVVYKKNQPLSLVFVITDDYRVAGSVMKLRPDGAADYRDMELNGQGGDRYSIDIPPDLHQNRPLEFYLEAVDISGHVGRMGSPEDPVRIKRKGLFKKVLEF